MASLGDKVLTTDVNTPYTLGYEVMGTGSVSKGYGQVTFGNNVTTSTIIGPNDFNNIRFDLLNASAHQNGIAAALTLAGKVAGQLVTPDDANTFAPYASTINTNRFNAHSSRITTSAYGGNSRGASWVSSVTATYSLTFANADVARYFWNAGGKIRLSSSRTGGAASSQNTSWSNLLSSAGTQEYGGIAVYSWSTGTTSLYSATASSPYSSNTYTIGVNCNTNNSGGGATVFNFILTWTDPYVDPSPGNPPLPEDIVDGTLSYSIELKYPTGGAALASPSGTYNWVGFNSGGTGGYYALPTATSGSISGG